MDWQLITAGLLAICWGIIWALFLQLHPKGRWMAQRRTYWTVIIGIGMDLILLLIIFPPQDVLLILWVVALSSIGLIARSLHNESQEEMN